MDNTALPQRDQALLEGLKRSDKNAFARIYNNYHAKLYVVAFMSLKSEDAAKEVVQEVFISLWVNRETVDIRQSIQGYLIGAVRHRVFNVIAKLGVRERYKREFLKDVDVAENSTERLVAYEELNRAIREQIGNLPETTRSIFVMSRFGGLNNGDIARQFNLSSKAVEYHITKALKVLRLRLRHVFLISVLILIA